MTFSPDVLMDLLTHMTAGRLGGYTTAAPVPKDLGYDEMSYPDFARHIQLCWEKGLLNDGDGVKTEDGKLVTGCTTRKGRFLLEVIALVRAFKSVEEHPTDTAMLQLIDQVNAASEKF